MPWYDSAETVVAAKRLDIPHQPGYPLYISLAAAFYRVFPLFTPSTRLSMLSATFCSAALLFFVLALEEAKIVMKRSYACTAALFLGFTPILWHCSIVCEVYTFELLLLCLLFYLAAANRRAARPRLAALAFLCGMTLCHRTSSAALAPALLLFWGRENLPSRKELPSLLFYMAIFLLPFLSYAYVYWRLGSPELVIADPKTPKSLSTILSYWTCQDYRHALFPYGPLELLVRLKHLLYTLLEQFPLLAFPLVFWGMAKSRREKPNVFWACLWIFLVNSSFVAGYAAMEADTMLLPSLLSLSIFFGYGLTRALEKLPPYRSVLVLALICIWTLFRSYSLLDWSRLTGAESFARRLSILAPRGGTLLLSNDVSYRPMLYHRYIKGKRRDLSFTIIDALDESNQEELTRLVQNRGLMGPLLHPPNLYPFLRDRFFLRPMGSIYGVSPKIPDFEIKDKKPLMKRLSLEFAPYCSLDSWQMNLIKEKATTRPSMLLLSYRWSCSKPSPRALLAIVVFANEDGDFFSKHGCLAFHDIHKPCYGYLDTNEWEKGSVYGESQVVNITKDIPKGKWTVYLGMAHEDDAALKALQVNELKGVNYLNYDGTEQVFRLKYGQRIGSPYWQVDSLEDIRNQGIQFLPLDKTAKELTPIGVIEIGPQL